MRRRSEAVDAERFALAGFDQASVTDQAGAQQRRRFRVAVRLRNRKTISLVGQRIFGVAAVQCVAGELCQIAEILPSIFTVGALPTRPAQPWDADAIADFKPVGGLAQFSYRADDFMAGNERQFRSG